MCQILEISLVPRSSNTEVLWVGGSSQPPPKNVNIWWPKASVFLTTWSKKKYYILYINSQPYWLQLIYCGELGNLGNQRSYVHVCDARHSLLTHLSQLCPSTFGLQWHRPSRGEQSATLPLASHSHGLYRETGDVKMEDLNPLYTLNVYVRGKKPPRYWARILKTRTN